MDQFLKTISIMQNKKKILIQITAVAFWVAVWFIVAMVQDNELLVPSPVAVIVALIELMGKSSFYVSVAGSLLRIMCGFLTGALLGTVLAYAGYKFKLLREFVAPLAGLCKSVPVAAFAVIILIWFGHEQIGFLISMIVVFPLVFINISEGLESVDEKLLEMADVFNMPGRNRRLYIFRPALRPYVLSAVKTGVGMAWKAGVAAEVIGLTNDSIGGELYTSKVYFETAQVFAWAGVIVLLSFCLEKLVLWLVRFLMDIQPKCVTMEKYVPKPCDVVLSGVCKSYGDNAIYRDFDRCFDKGMVHTVSTPSGSGKTTLLKMIAGIIKADSGEIRAGRISMVFQEDRLCEDYSAVKNVCMTGIDEAAARKALEAILDGDCLDKPCRELSGGMKRRVAIARAVTYGSDVILMDEPYTGMDEDTIGSVKKYIEDGREGRTMIVATHIL